MSTSVRHVSAMAVFLCAICWSVLGMPAGQQDPPKPPMIAGPTEPKKALKELCIAAGLRIELVACEPQIESPVAMQFDEDGKLWVVEMRDYPHGPAPGKPPAGRIRILQDKDGDGFYEHSSVFADNLLFANGLLRWKDGVIVTAAPHIVWLRDTDGDGKADKREILYEGFATQNPQLRVSHPILGIDNWIYVANGLRGGQVIRSGKKDAKPINLSGMDFRFDPIGDRAEAISGTGQFGNTFDDWGNRFVCDNRHHLRHVVIEQRYLKRNPYLIAPSPVEDISELDDGPLSSGGKIYPISKNWTTSNLHAGRFTAACGVHIHRGTLLDEPFRGAAFTCDPTGNLVHMETLKPHGATFKARPFKPGVEFLASPDDWFRPVSLADGPDGALYVVDMCRAFIEHPEFMPPELRKRPDLDLGKERGRIWRIVPEKHKTQALRPQLGKLTSGELADLFKSEDGWERTTAQRLILQRQDRSVVRTLHGLATSASEFHRLHSYALLDAFGSLSDQALGTALIQETDGRCLEQLVRLAEPRLAKSADLRDQIVRLAQHPEPRVRYQSALTLGAWDDERIVEPLARIALAGADDRWTRLAVASAIPLRAGTLITALLPPKGRLPAEPTAGQVLLLTELAGLVGARRDPSETASVLESLLTPKNAQAGRVHLLTLSGLAEGMGRRGVQLAEFVKSLPADKRHLVDQANALFARAAALASNDKLAAAQRLDALRLLAHGPWQSAEPALTRLLNVEAVQELRLAAVRALAAHPQPEVPPILLKSWRSYTPALRREVTEAMMRQPERTLYLLNEIEKGRIKPADIDVLRTRQLMNHKNPKIKALAQTLLKANLPADRKLVFEQYQAALKLKGDPERGKVVFQKNCATCHKVAGVGVDVGPDISDTRTKLPEALLIDILNPNQAIDNNYVGYIITTKSGKQLTGMIAAETAASITLRRAENQTDSVLRQDIDEIQSTGVSLMPEGLEKTIAVQEMADLLGFLKNWRYVDGKGPNTPPGERK
jgi:putative membrane-bound dehydrogenase-like protein